MRRGVSVLLALAALTSLPSLASSQALIGSVPIATYQGNEGGNILAIAKSGSTVYVGGTFDYIGSLTGSAVLADTTTGAIAPGFPMSDGNTYSAAPDGAGGWYVNGTFAMIGGKPRNGLARLHSDLSVDDNWVPPVRLGDDNPRGPIIVSGGTVYVAGGGGQSLSRPVRAYDATTGAELSTFNPGNVGRINAMVLSGSTLFIGGSFATMNGQPRANLAAIDANTGAVLPWTCDTNGTVYALALDSGMLYVGGSFGALGGFARTNLGSVNAGTGATSAWTPNPNSNVRCLVVTGGRIYVGGAFTMIAGVARNNLASIDASTLAPTSWDPNIGVNSGVYTLAVSGTTAYFGGPFTTVGSQKRLRAGAVDATTGVPTAWRAQANDEVDFVTTQGTQVLLAGSFESIGGEARMHLASYNATTGVVSSWDPSPNGIVYAIALDATNVYVGGDFNTIGGQARLRMAALSPSTGLATSWNPAPDGAPHSLVVSGSIVYVCGGFGNIGGAARVGLAALNVSNGLATTWNPGANAQVNRILLSGSLVYVGGNFTNIGGQARTGLAALSPSTGLANAWNPGASNVYGMSSDGAGILYVFGDFASAGVGAPLRAGIAGIDMTTGAANAFDPHAFYSSGIHPAGDIVFANSKVYVAASGPGGPITIGGQTRFLAELDPSTSMATSFNPYFGAFFNWLAAPFLLDGTILYAGGQTALKIPAGPLRRNLNAFDLSIQVAVGDPSRVKPLALSLGPNPAVGSTRIVLTLPQTSRVCVQVFDLQGRDVARIAEGTLQAGTHEFVWDGRASSGRRESGVYFVRADAVGQALTKRIVIFH